MSYILDALRRADSERERGAVPSLHSKQVSAGLADADDDEAPGRSAQPLRWAVGVLALALVIVVAWMLMGRSAPEPQPMAAAPVAPPPSPSPAMQPQATSTAAIATTALPAPAPTPAPTLAPPPQQAPAVRAAPATERKSVAPATPPVQVAAAKPVRPTEKRAENPAAPAAPKDDDAPVPSVSELPDEFRRQLPTLSVSGASYSKNPASRMLILNGQVFKEGDKVANDLVLEQIRLKSAVLSFRGRRYSISF